MNRSSISFIMPAFNCSGTIRESVESIYSDNFAEGDELIIVDDASTDKTPDVIEDLKKSFPGISSYRHRINKGSAAAGRNTGIDACKNELIFCLDSDNLLLPNSIPRLKEHLHERNADAACFGELSFFTENPQEITHYWVFTEEVTLADALAGTIHPCGSGNYLYTRTSWKRAGRYNESLGGAYDSWGFGITQLATGSRMVTLPETSYLHRYGYESTFVRESGKRNPSLLALQVLIPILDQVLPSELEYLFGREGRLNWFERLRVRPLRTKTGAIGREGVILNANREQQEGGADLSMWRKVLGGLSKLISPGE